MGVYYYKTCDKCGKVLVENCLNTSANPYADYAVVSLKIMSKGKATSSRVFTFAKTAIRKWQFLCLVMLQRRLMTNEHQT